MNRRDLLKAWGGLILGGGLSWPLYAFIKTKRFRPPIERRISKQIKPGDIAVEPEFVLFGTDSGPVAVSRTCTHLGCRVNYLEKEGIFLCPCHQSRFSKEGKYLSGPARKDLAHFEVKVMEDGQGLVVFLPR